MKPFSRSDRIGGQIQKIIAELLRKQISDPRLSQATITGVKVSSDLRIAKIYYSAPADGDAPAKALEGFERAQGFIKRELAQQLGLRYMPDLKFFFDESIEYGARIEQLLNAVKKSDETGH